MNDRDSEAVLGLFLDKGYLQVQSAEEADVVLVNTCSVRAHAEDRARSYLGSLKKISQSIDHSRQSIETEKKKSMDHGLSTIDSQQRRKPIVGLIGCMAANQGEELSKRMPHIDLICGPASFEIGRASCRERV